MTKPLHSLHRPAVPIGLFHSWWRDGQLPALPELPGLNITPVDDARLIAAVAGIDAFQAAQRMRRGHRAWVARLDGEPASWGWRATSELSIGELGISCALPPGQRYLWDFFTVPRRRGLGIYPRLLQAIVASEPEVERFWVGHDFGNTASARGIAKAGFREVGVVYRLPDGAFALVPSCPPYIAAAASELFGVTVFANRADVPSPTGDDR